MGLPKELKDLNLLDRFLFAEAMEDPEFVQNVLEIILERDIQLKNAPQAEREARRIPANKQIRLDVWAEDIDDTVYGTEVQKKNTKNLPKRSRYYQGLTDSRLLEVGCVDYNQLKDSYIIVIAPFDLFGKGLYRYTFRMICEEVPGCKLNDGAVRIFLNTRGTNPEGVNQELIDLLHYFQHTSAKVSEQSASDKIHRLQKKIECIKANEEIGVKYMNAWEEKVIEREEARQEGLEEGRAAGRLCGHKEIVVAMSGKGLSAEEISELTGLEIKLVEDFMK